MAKELLLASTVAAFVSLVIFVVVYMKVPWHATPLGRAIMAGAWSVGLLTSVGLVRRLDTRVESLVLEDVIMWGSALAYTTIALVWAYKTYVLLTSDDDDPPP